MKPLIIFLATIAGIGAACGLLYWDKAAVVVYQAARSSSSQTLVKTATTSVFFLGDIMLARDVENKLKAQPLGYAFAEVPFLLNAAVVVGNFEAAIPEIHQPTPSMVMKFSVDPALLPVLKLGGLTHLSLANNHALDQGHEGYANTIVELEASGFDTFGHPVRVDENSVSYFEGNGRKFALIGLNATYGELPLIWSEVLATATLHSDIQIAYIHWGEEYELAPSGGQQQLAHLLIDAGFDLVIGHHPHVVQSIEKYRHGLIFYSLGNFIFDQYWNRDVSEGLVVELVLDGGNDQMVLYPVETRTTRVKPQLMTAAERERFLIDLSERSSLDLSPYIKAGQIPLQF